jgi:hypothetical protein
VTFVLTAARAGPAALACCSAGQGPAYVPVATAVNAQYRPRPVLCSSALTHPHEAQFRSRRGRRQRSIGPVVSLAARQ